MHLNIISRPLAEDISRPLAEDISRPLAGGYLSLSLASDPSCVDSCVYALWVNARR